MKPWRERSLTTRATLAFVLVVCAVVSALGMYFYESARVALLRHADVALVGRVEHFRNLLVDLYTVNELKARPLLFESMLGNEKDVLIFRKPGAPSFIQVNPDRVPVPADLHAPVPQAVLDLRAVERRTLQNGVPMHWVAATALVGEHHEVIEIIGGHPLIREARMLAAYRTRVVLSVSAAVLLSALLAFLILSRGLRPLIRIAERAAEVSPHNLSARLEEEGVPRELRRLTSAFNAMLERLDDGYRRISQFSADLAHEIRTPIGTLIGQSEVTLAMPRTMDEYQGVLESNLEELNRLSHIAENILFLAHADHAGLSLECSPVALDEELRKIADYFEGLADERGLRFDVQAEGIAWAHPALCRRAINNLVLNAVRYAQRGTMVQLRAAQAPGGAVISVLNVGRVVPPEQLSRLFDRFYRGDAARSEFTESSGLGLSIVRAIMTLHGGSASVSCPRPDLICFELRFPDRPDAPPHACDPSVKHATDRTAASAATPFTSA